MSLRWNHKSRRPTHDGSRGVRQIGTCGPLARLGIVLVVTGGAVGVAFPCTTVCLESGREVLFGKNYDWDFGDGLVVVNKRGVAKQSLADVNPAFWVSKYGSVTFNGSSAFLVGKKWH